MKSLITSLLLFLTLASWAQPLPKLFKKLSKSVVFIDVVSYDYSNLIYNQTVGEEESLGSGVLISENGMIWTASHVIQHAEKIKVEFLTGKTEPKKRKDILKKIKNGEINCLIGTHALFQKKIEFKSELFYSSLNQYNATSLPLAQQLSAVKK